MTKKKLMILLTLVCALCFTLVACGPDEGGVGVTVELNKQTLELTVGQTETLTATVPVQGVAVTWSSSDEAIATVSKGTVKAIAAGEATVTAKVGDAKATCRVTVKSQEAVADPVITVEEGYEDLIIFNVTAREDVDLLAGISAKDSGGAVLDVEIVSDGGLDVTKVGKYTVTYKATDAQDRYTEVSRDAYVTYFGITSEMLDGKTVSEATSWSYALVDEARTAEEWSQTVVPGHSSNWNRFEGPVENYIVMHGSDTNGREAITDEIDDELPNTMLWNKLIVPSDNTVFRVFCSVNPYPDYNNLLSKVRLAVYDVEAKTFAVVDGYREIKAPLNASREGLDYDYIRTKSFQDFDLSAYAGKQVILFIQQDAPETVYQEDYYKDIGYAEFQIPTLITETRDTLVVYGMNFVKGEEAIDYSGLVTDTTVIWGLDDTSDYTRWGLRGDEAAKGKWIAVFLNGATGSLNNVTGLGGSLQLIAREAADRRDGGIIVRDAVLMNRVNVGENKYFQIYVGTDSDAVNVNYRLTFVTADGTEYHLAPKFTVDGYTPLYDGWATVQKSQWVEGVKLIYDVSEFKNQTVVILIEQDENAEAGEGNCTLWFNKAAFIADMTFAPADYTQYNAIKQQVEEANYNEADYTEMSWSILREALEKFNKVPQDLVNEQQSEIDSAVKALTDAISLLTEKPAPVTPPADTTDGILAEDMMGFTTSDWLGLPVDASGVWGTDAALGEYWGLRGDTTAKSAWKWYVVNNGILYHGNDLKSSLQSVAYECGNDSAEAFGADAMFLNKVWVRNRFLRVFVGCDDVSGTVNVRVRLIKGDGTVVTLSAMKYTAAEATPVADGWYTIKASQWVYGTALIFDVADYLDGIVTVVIEQDQNEAAEGTTCTMWLNKVEFMAGADYTAYNALRLAIEDANYQEDKYTEDSYAAFTAALTVFNALSSNLTVEEQAVVDKAVKDMNDAATALTEKGAATLEKDVGGFNDAAWKTLELDSSGVWGTDGEAGTWGMRGDTQAQEKWSIYGTNQTGSGLIILDVTETEDDDSAKIADNVLANKVTVSADATMFSIWVGTDWSVTGSNVRVSVVTSDGKIHTLSTCYTETGYTVGSDGWGTVSISQWVYGTKIGYDMSDYAGQTVTILIEHDGVGTGRSTLWFVKAAFEAQAT